ALRVLEDAAARYSCPELEATIKVETAIQRLDAKRQLLESDIHAAENDLANLSGPLEELAGIVAEEKRTRDQVARLEDERRRARAAEIAVQLRRDDENRAECERLGAEARDLEGQPRIQPSDEAEFQATIGRLAEIERQRETLVARRAALEQERRGLDAEWEGLAAFRDRNAEDADRLAADAQEIRRLDGELEDLGMEL